MKRIPLDTHPAPRSRRGRAGAFILVGVAIGVGVLFLRGREGAPEAPAEMTLEERYERDERIRPLLDDCPFGRPFEADTTDLAAVLVSKLDEKAQREPMRRASAVLAEMGDEAAEPLARLFEDALRDRMRLPVAKNVLAVCAKSTSDFGVELARIGLSSPYEDIRRESTIVIGRHPSPEIYDAVLAALPSLETPAILSHAHKALYLSDQKRFAEELGRWIEEARPEQIGGPVTSAVLESAVSFVASTSDPEAAEILRSHADEYGYLLVRHRLPLLAPAARFGDETALQELLDTFASDRRRHRARAATALAKAGIGHHIQVLAETAESSAERAEMWTLALEPMNHRASSEEEVATLFELARGALGSPEPEVRDAVLGPLLRRGNEQAQAYLMQQLRSSARERSAVTRTMRDTFVAGDDFADRVRAYLAQAWEAEMAGSRTKAELRSIITALGAVPGRATGEYLFERAIQIGELNAQLPPGESSFLEPKDALAQVFNAGPAARDVLLEKLGTVTDPFLRLDLIYFAWQDFGDDSFEVLAGILEDTTLSPYERLYAADRMLRMGKPAELLPIMKRVHRSSTDPVLQPGLHCLLWIWFGPPLEQ